MPANFTGSLAISGSLIISGSILASGSITISGSIASASYAEFLGGLPSSSFASASVFNQVSSSYSTASGSLSTRVTNLESTSSTVSSSFASTSGSIAGRVNIIETSYATTGSNNFTRPQQISDVSNAISFTSTASLYTAGGLRVSKDSFVSGTAYFNNVVVYGTSSIQYITSSQVNIGTNIITVNTDTPAVRFGGLAVFDSGSTALTGSLLWDSLNNRWIYSNPSGSTYDGGMLISGPRNTTGLGNEVGTTACAVMIGQGADHITSSGIFSYGNATCFYGNSFISSSGNACFSGQVCSNTVSTTDGTNTSTLANNYLRYNGGDFYVDACAVGGNFRIRTSNTTALDSTALFICGKNSNVGIGTSSPGYKLDVNASSGDGIQATVNGTVLGLKITQSSATDAAVIRQQTNGHFYDLRAKSDNSYAIQYDGADRMVITSGGIACFACQVCALNFITPGITNSTSAVCSNYMKVFCDTSDTRYLQMYMGNPSTYNPAPDSTVCKIVSGIEFNWYSENWKIGATRGGGADICNFVIGRNGATQMVLTVDSKIGLCTTTPATRIGLNSYVGARLPYINGTGNTFDSNGITVGNSNNGNTNIGGGIDFTNNCYCIGAYSPILSFSSISSNYTYNNAYAGIWGVLEGQATDANWVKGALVFGTAYSAGITERMRISCGGAVGIGTSTLSAEANLFLGAQGTVEGGQLVLQKGTSCNCATHLDNYQNTFRIMSGTDTGSTTVNMSINHTNGAAVFNGYMTAYGYQSIKGTITLASGATGTIYNVGTGTGQDGIYYVAARVGGGSQIYFATGIVSAMASAPSQLFLTSLYDGANVTLSVSGSNIRITNDGFATLTWSYSIIFQPID